MHIFVLNSHFTDKKSCCLHFKLEPDKISLILQRCKGKELYRLFSKKDMCHCEKK